MTGRLRRCSINPRVVDKHEGGDTRAFAEGFEKRELTIEQLAAETGKGHAFAAELNGRRKGDNFVAADVVAVDIDSGMTIEQALEHPIVKAGAALLYTTVSHTEAAHRYRIVFPLAKTITDPKEMRAIQRALALRLGGDPSATDPARLFFGNRDAKIHLFPDRVLSLDLQEELIAQGLNAPAPDSVDSGNHAGVRSALRLGTDHPVKLARTRRTVALSQVSAGSPVFCPFHDDRNASAFVVAGRRGGKGVRCSTCDSTYWADTPTVDFNEFETAVRSIARNHEQNAVLSPLAELFGIRGAPDSIKIVNGDPAPFLLEPGITLIKSAKGTGKTRSLRRLIERARSVTLVGHRVALIGKSCDLLGLRSYQTLPRGGTITVPFNGKFGVCLDSLLRFEHREPPEILILDESEQVLAHFLSDTLERHGGGGRSRIFYEFKRLVASAKYVVALDADLGFITYRVLTRMRAEGHPIGAQGRRNRRQNQVHVWLNEAKPAQTTIEMYQSKPHLIAELKQALVDGKRCYVASNSKAELEALSAVLAAELPEAIQLIITADTRSGEDQLRFIANPGAEAVRYKVILVSPAIGTGVDIWFEGDEKKIDLVFGLFEALVVNHFDLDQQLGRVRNPGAVKAWISPRRFAFETHPEAVKSELLHKALYRDLIIDHGGAGGTPRYHEEDAFLELAAQVVSRDRASKNELGGHFISLKKSQECVVQIVPTHESLATIGRETRSRGAALSETNFAARLLAAAPLRQRDFQDAVARLEAGEPVAEDQRWSLGRTRLELYYREPLSADLVGWDNRGRNRKALRVLQDIQAKSAAGKDDDPTPLNTNLRFLRSSQDKAAAIAQVLRLTPLLKGGVWDANVKIQATELSPFVDFVFANKGALENLLELEISRDLASKPVLQLSRILKLVGLRLISAGNSKSKQKKIYRYNLDPILLDRVRATLRRRETVSAWRFMSQLYGWHDEELIDPGTYDDGE